jgi:hypothetical protein
MGGLVPPSDRIPGGAFPAAPKTLLHCALVLPDDGIQVTAHSEFLTESKRALRKQRGSELALREAPRAKRGAPRPFAQQPIGPPSGRGSRMIAGTPSHYERVGC